MSSASDPRPFGNFLLAPSAEKFMKRMVRFDGKGATPGFRLTVSPGGCSGLSAEFSVEQGPANGDKTIDSAGLRVFVPESSLRILEGVIVEFEESPTKSGLTFIDPKAGVGGCSTGGSKVLVKLGSL